MKKCNNCGKSFLPDTGTQLYCRAPCRELSPDKAKCRKLHSTIERYEREVVDTMTLVQLERKKLDEMKVYRIHYNRVKDYLTHSVEPTIEDIKGMFDV